MLLAPPPFLRVWRPGSSPYLELVLGQQGWYDTPAHVHDELELSLSPLHPRTLQVAGRTWRVPAGAVSAVMPGEHHRTRAELGANVFYSLRIHPQLLSTVWHGLQQGGDLPRLLTVLPAPALAQAVLRLHRLAGHAPGLDQAALEARLRVLLALLFQVGSAPGEAAFPAASAGIERARAAMEKAPDEAFPLARLAGEAGLSPAHFARVFRAATGQSPHAYLLDARMRRAKQLLMSDEPLAQVALTLGFAGQSHFARTFRRLVGVTPQQFRQDSRILVDRERPWGASSGHDG